MPSNDHKGLYLQLHKITGQIKAALAESNYDALTPMMAVHQGLLKQLNAAGNCSDPNMMTLLKSLKSDVDDVIKELETKKGAIREEIKISGNKRKLAKAYGV